MVQRNIALPVFLIIENAVALAEGAATAILTREPHRSAPPRERAEGQRLGECPVVGPPAFQTCRRRSSRIRLIFGSTRKSSGTVVSVLAIVSRVSLVIAVVIGACGRAAGK